jgi:P4 family phage/plasmid primase-like protien
LSEPKTPYRFAQTYAESGLSVVPVPYRKKGPVLPEWEKLRITPETLPNYFEPWKERQNVGVILGEPSQWLVDVDLDCQETVRLAPIFLRSTLTFGRPTKPRSHWLYVSKGAPTAKYNEPAKKHGEKPATLVELRSTGCQTVFPGSTHATGETITFDPECADAPLEISADELSLAVKRLAAAARYVRSGLSEGDAIARAKADDFSILDPSKPAVEARRERMLDLVANTPRIDPQGPGPTGDVGEAARRYNQDHAAENRWPDPGKGTCPACGHNDCFGRWDENPLKWSCFSTAHAATGCGKEGKAGKTWFGDALDLAAYAAGCDRRAFLQREGYLRRRYNLTDTGNAERFRDRHAPRVCHVKALGGWRVFDGRRWVEGGSPEMGLAIETVRSILDEADLCEEEKERDALLAWAKACENWKYLSPMLKIAQSMVAAEPTAFDTDTDLLNVSNGTLDLRTGKLRPHAAKDMITKLAPVEYAPAARAPTWEKFLARVVPDKEARDYLQRATGYALSGAITEAAFCFLYGGGKNGKTTFLTTIQAIMGDYACEAAPDLMLRERHGGSRHPTEILDLMGARFVVSTEVDEDREFDEALIKRITGGDRMKGRRMGRDFIEFNPTHKLFMAGNHKPEVRGTDDGIWRRIHLVPFTVQISEAERDPRLPEKLRAEAPGVLNWLLQGYRAWREKGLAPPQVVLAAVAEYREEQDQLGQFIESRCVLESDAWTAFSELYDAYSAWARATGERIKTKKSVGQYLNGKGFPTAHNTTGDQRGRRGLRLKPGPMAATLAAAKAMNSAKA